MSKLPLRFEMNRRTAYTGPLPSISITWGGGGGKHFQSNIFIIMQDASLAYMNASHYYNPFLRRQFPPVYFVCFLNISDSAKRNRAGRTTS